MQQHSYVNILPADPRLPHSPRGWGKKVKIQLFQNMVMLHTKLNGITKCSNMVANSLPSDTPPLPHDSRGWCQRAWCQKVRIQLQNMVMLHINLKGIMNAATRSQLFSPRPPPPPPPLPQTLRDGVKIHTFSENGHVAYQIKETQMQQHCGQYFAPTVLLHIKLKGIANAATW